ncbi:MAG: hypothetical protein ABFS28_09240 [Bacteroidota bacterium]
MKIQSACLLIFLITLLSAPAGAQEAEYPERLRRSESFLGIHFDFHAGEDCNEIGKGVTRGMVDSIIQMVKPDYIQVDCKGHRGFSSYPTKVGNQAPGFVKDPLKIFRQATAKQGVALYCHYSGVIDHEAVNQHPEWAVVGHDGKVVAGVTSVFGPYVDELLIPQLKELNDQYHVDGVWIDGECWGTERDYRPEIAKQYREQTGNKELPRAADDPGWHEFSQFFREGFRQYVDHYTHELHAHNPRFQLTSNWAYSSFMPEKVSTGVDFLSGDIVPSQSINAARLESRILAQQGMPWDLMAWSFSINWDDPGGFQSAKSVVQLQQEASQVLSQGGGFQVYFNQRRDASMILSDMNTMSEVADFCRVRQPYTHRCEPVPQIGLILSTDAYYRNIRKLFQASFGEMDGVKGTLQMLLEKQDVVDVVMEHNLEENIHRYPLLIYPEWSSISPELKQKLVQYVEEGGKLLVTGAEATSLFEEELGVEFPDSASLRTNHLCYQDRVGSVKSLSQEVRLGDESVPFGKIYSDKQRTGQFGTAGSIRRLGNGRIAGIYLNLGARYLNGKVTVARDYLDGMVDELFPAPMVSVTGSQYVDVSLNRVNGKLAVNLINTAGPHANTQVYVYDEIPPVGPLRIEVSLENKPESVSVRPSGLETAWSYKNQKLTVLLPRLEFHELILIED